MMTPVRTAWGKLESLGRMPWADIQTELRDATCVWSDLSGLNVGQLPPQQPLATHLWAWRGAVAWRIRLDPGVAIGARLTVGEGEERITIHDIDARTTPDNELAALLADVVEKANLAITEDRAPMSFLVEASR